MIGKRVKYNKVQEGVLVKLVKSRKANPEEMQLTLKHR
jgi:hypothetical protein